LEIYFRSSVPIVLFYPPCDVYRLVVIGQQDFRESVLLRIKANRIDANTFSIRKGASHMTAAQPLGIGDFQIVHDKDRLRIAGAKRPDFFYGLH